MNRIDLNPNLCCGCAACANVCSHKAIMMVEDNHGFIYPSINESICVDCGLCNKVCDFKNVKRYDNNTLHVYSLIHNNKKIVKHSTSGGAFTALSDLILSDGGYVIGAVMEPNFTIHHLVTSDASVRDKMRGSKYVQSSMDQVYKEMKDLLKKGKKVMFTGTPCQCAAIKNFFSDKYENLYIVDFLCHGVPNNKMFKEHIAFLEEQYGKKIVYYTFRDKRYGWDAYNNNNNNEDGTIGTRLINQAYYYFFLRNLSLRDGCFHCKYRSQYRYSDITIADFWGIEKITGKKNCTGVSMVLSNSEKGETLLRRSKDTCNLIEYPYEKIAYRIPLTPYPYPAQYERFWKTYAKGGYSALVSNFFNNSFKKRLYYSIRKIVKKLMLCYYR